MMEINMIDIFSEKFVTFEGFNKQDYRWNKREKKQH